MAESAYQMLRDMFARYGLPVDNSDIINVIKDSAIAGESPELTQLKLQETETWKRRFAGNEKRRAAGLNVLSIPEYLQQEKQYADVLHNAGLPSGFFDDPSDFADFIGNSVSVGELQDRVSIASDIVSREDPAVMEQLSLRGITTGQLIAHTLDPQRAAPLIKRDQQSILIGAAAARAGVGGVGVNLADRLAERGVGEAQATQGFGQISEFMSDTDKLGDIYGVDYGTDDAVGEVFDGSGGEKRKRLARTERASFGGQTSFGVARRDSAGAF